MEWYYNDEFKPIIIEGNHGYGKTTFACIVASEIYETWDWSSLKKYIVFTPQEFLARLNKLKKKQPLLIWDDAGYWLNSLDYQNKFVKAVGKYIQVARTDWACIIFTSISAKDIINKVRGIQERYKIRITKHGCNITHPNARTAVTYTYWETPDGSRFGERNPQTERFEAHMPDTFYERYRPYRKTFTNLAKKTIQEYLDEINK